MMLNQWLDTLLMGHSEIELAKAYQRLSQRYHQPNYAPGFQNELEVKAYAAARMPATFAAILRTLAELPDDFSPTSVLDLGAGTGAASLAALQHFPLIHSLTVVEQDAYALMAAQQLIQSIWPKGKATFCQGDLDRYTDDKPYDLVILSYVLNELPVSKQKKILQSVLATQSSYILILMPGTPLCFQQLLHLRDVALAENYFLAAPCPHQQACPMANTPSDWCHFTVRLPRSRVHRLSKLADLNFEDEKFCYLLLSKNSVTTTTSRIVKKPAHRSGHVILDVCEDGDLKRKIIGRKQKDLYKTAIKLKWGDLNK